MSNLSRIDQPSKLKRYFATTKVARYVSSSAIAGAVTWIFTANSGLGFLVPGGLGPVGSSGGRFSAHWICARSVCGAGSKILR